VSFRRRLTVLVACAVAAAVGVSSIATYLAHRAELRSEIDRSLDRRAADVAGFAAQGFPEQPQSRLPTTRPGQLETYLTVVRADGSAHSRPGDVALPVVPAARVVQRGGSGPVRFETHLHGDHVRVLVTRLPHGATLEVGRSLSEVDHLLGRLRLILLAVIAGGIALAGFLGRLVADRALGPVRRLSEATDYVARTRDLAPRLTVGGRDELNRLAANFNLMLDALEGSVRAQRQLVADASHELRTPITSVRTNVEVLQEHDADLGPERRAEVLGRVLGQISELTQLVDDVIELARGDHEAGPTEPLRLDDLVVTALERAERHASRTRFVADLEPTVVDGDAARLARAVNNLLDNAVRWNEPGAPVEVTLRDGVLTVRDHGAGIEPDDRELVFDRFYRAAAARRHPGSGLGLAIVRQVAEAHGGSVIAEAPEGGGTALVLRLPVSRPAAAVV
jgi:two-component system sensor histidine kinase MprB